MVWGFLLLGFLYGFLILCWFDVFLIFWGFLFFDFLMLFGCFFDFSTIFFLEVGTIITHQKGYILLQFICNLFFFVYNGCVDEVTPKSHRAGFEALRLVFNRLLKYKKV